MYSDWAADLQFEFKRIGSFGLSYNKKDRHTLWLSWIAGRLNKVPGMRFISPDTFLEMEKDVEVRPRRVLYAPTTAYVDGFEVTIALAENAAMNGVRFHLSTEVVDVDVEDGVVRGVVTDRGLVKEGSLSTLPAFSPMRSRRWRATSSTRFTREKALSPSLTRRKRVPIAH